MKNLEYNRQTEKDITEYTIEKFYSIVSFNAYIKEYINYLKKYGDVWIFGGFIRDIIKSYVENNELNFNDIDLVIDTHASHKSIINIPNFNLNIFGGFEFHEKNFIKIDVWELNNTYAFTKYLFQPSITNLNKTAVFNINAITMNLDGEMYGLKEVFKAVKNKTIRFNCRKYLNDFREYQAFRAMKFLYEFNYSMHESIMSFVGKTLRDIKKDTMLQRISAFKSDISMEYLDLLINNFWNEVNAIPYVNLNIMKNIDI